MDIGEDLHPKYGFNNRSKEGFPLTIAQRIHKMLQLDGHEFIKAVYPELLNRQPDPDGLNHHVHALRSGTSKLQTMAGIVQSHEAASLYQNALSGSVEARTIANRLQQLYAQKTDSFVHHLYKEILCREPDPGGAQAFIHRIQHGHSRQAVIAELLVSHEFKTLMSLNKHAFAKEILERLIQTFYK
jgi:hypothetical protein